LTCNCHLVSSPISCTAHSRLTVLQGASPSSPYCSTKCRSMAGPSLIPADECDASSDDGSYDELSEEAVYYHDIEDSSPIAHYTGNDYDGIVAWAAAVVPGPPSQELSRPPSRRSTSSSRSSIKSSISSRQSYRPASPSPNTSTVLTPTFRAPELLRKHRPLPPTLCMSTSKPARSSPPSKPIGASTAHLTIQPTASAANSISTRTTESSLATPVSVSAAGFVFESLKSWIAPCPSQVPTKDAFDFDQSTPAPLYVPDAPLKSRQQRGRLATRTAA